MSAAAGPDLAQDGLVLCLDAGNRRSYSGSGTIWRDLSGRDNNGTLINGPTFTTANQGGIVFDNTDDIVNCGQGSDLNITTNFTLDVWFNAAGFGENNFGRLFDKSGVSNILAWAFFLDNFNVSNGVQFATDNSARHTIANCVTFGRNTNFTLVYTNSRSSIYRNGVFLSSSPGTFTVPSTSTLDLHIGNRYDTARTFNGTIYSAKIYNRALRASEIIQNYNSTKGRFRLT